MCHFYSCVIKNFVAIYIKPFDLLRKDLPWIWDEDCDKAFAVLNKHHSNVRTFGFPHYSHKFLLTCDASDLAEGADRSKILHSEGIAIAFICQKLISAQIKYATIDKQFFALILADPDIMKIADHIYNFQPLISQIIDGTVFHFARKGTSLYIPMRHQDTVLEYALDIVGHQDYN
ncbi:hypothetical protein RF11_00618 [Thelohanellus kitauei]|uniref:Reverse transcriptase/retrotransposon-derived protein RNase H-like domain-containing protein n=1 Tax=Thelohanellus kitauei TaxID=669202 RepID=A0A0C2MGR8_THEKT|nr:hypothetical protein RF11_00618 [Thelohanellus kitauei]